MIDRLFSVCALALSMAVLSGCGSSYSWRSSVPEELRTVSVPTFRNESTVVELGAVAARQVLREFEREGTFRVRANGDSVLEIQGVIKSAGSSTSAYDRRSALRVVSCDFTVVAEVSVIDRRNGRVLIDNRSYRAETTFSAGQDLTTAKRDASGRAADELSRKIVDDVVNLKW